tara:strand:+ start:5493 stop:5915 length:423 start_codon:yes stop_codon:yes gene_type:complete
MKSDNKTATEYAYEKTKKIRDEQDAKLVEESDEISEDYDEQQLRRLMSKEFDPEGSGYDYKSAVSAGLEEDEDGHWPSRVPSGPNEGLLLKGKKHETWDLLEEAEEDEGNEIIEKNGRFYSFPEGSSHLKTREEEQKDVE